MPSFPADPDAWTETLSPPEGSWAYAHLDSGFFVDGNFSVASDSDIMWFDLKNPLDITQWETIVFYGAVSMGAYNVLGVTLRDAQGRQMFREVYVPAVHVFQGVELGLREGWVVDEGFDPAKVTRIYFGTVAGTVWIDLLRFFRILALTPVTVESEPSGKNMELSGAKGVTPFTWRVSPGSYTLKAEPNRFIKWEDESTNLERSITILVGHPVSFKAYYTKGPSRWPLALLIGFGFIGVATVLYVRLKK
ncbi:hypothetical protein ES702_00755 [subsurface metagenome]